MAGTPDPFPGTVNETTFFATLSLSVTPGTVVSVEATSQDGSSFLSIYQDSFNPASLATNFLGDAGSSFVIPPAQPSQTVFSVTAPASGQVVVVANTVGGSAGAVGHSFSVDVTFNGPTAAPAPPGLVLCGAGALVLAGCRLGRRRLPAAAP
jgi:hypothetical protein